MYAEQLYTPHETLTEPGQLRVPLYDAVETDYKMPRVEQIIQVQDGVRNSLRILERSTQVAPDSTLFDVLVDSQNTNCFGYTIVGSEMLEKADIPHWVAYANGHAFIVAPFDDNSGNPRMYMADMMLPRFNQDMTAAVEDPVEVVQETISDAGRSAVKLQADQLTYHMKEDLETLTVKHPWLRAGKPKTMLPHIGEQERQSDYRIIMSLYEAAQGRIALEQYSRLQTALFCRDYQEARTLIARLRGLYPDIDARNQHDEIRKLIKGLLTEGDIDGAYTAAGDYFASFNITQDGRPHILYGDLLRLIAKGSNGVGHLEEAFEHYSLARERCRGWQSLIAGKLSVTSSLIQQRTEIEATAP